MLGLRSYVEFVSANRHLAAFGFLTAVGSSFGQTFFIGIFGPSVQAEFGLSHTVWSTIYLLGTLTSAALLPWTGKQIDKLPLRQYAAMVWIALAISCVVFSLAWAPAALVVGIFMLRQCGQGLMSHVALTSMARFFESARGRAIAIASLGFALGEACLPVLAVVMIDDIGWRWTYRVGALALALGVVLALWLLRRGRPVRPEASAPESNSGPDPETAVGENAQSSLSGWTRAEVLRDKRFYLLLPGLLCPSVIITAMFFHHLNVADVKGWSHEWITGNYLLFAIAATITSLIAGQLIDRFGAIRVIPALLLPQAMGLACIALSNDALAVLPYMLLIGTTTGISHTVVSALWAELYGTAHIGAIRSLAAAMSVFGSALGPVTMGGLMDLGFTVETVMWCFVGYCLIGTACIVAAVSGRATPRGVA